MSVEWFRYNISMMIEFLFFSVYLLPFHNSLHFFFLFFLFFTPENFSSNKGGEEDKEGGNKR